MGVYHKNKVDCHYLGTSPQDFSSTSEVINPGLTVIIHTTRSPGWMSCLEGALRVSFSQVQEMCNESSSKIHSSMPFDEDTKTASGLKP